MTALAVAAGAVMLAAAGALAVVDCVASRRQARRPRQPLRVSLASAPPLPAAPARTVIPSALRHTRAQSTLLRPYAGQIPVHGVPAGTALPVPPFATAEEAVAWMRAEYAAMTDAAVAGMLSPQGLYRRLAKHCSPGTQGRLDAARQVLARKGTL